ncbi:hypothetical protein ISO4_00675 [Alcanivorax venustensis ISO4]|uniref:Glycosyltransferase RgtA/B/C/D-like domain-containing protein n=2 Tax=Alloalcanivorax venustensis TaxID=172371 RepID=A0ABS0ADC3_9GAMM|nr:hypothetical protein [Alloalcanivorax venustensis ISO4]
MLYVHVADLLLSGNFDEALKQFDWPFFSILIAAVSKVSFVPSIYVAYGIAALAAAGVTVTLASLLYRVAPKSGIFLSAFVVLAFPALNEYRDLVIRDWPAWFFMVLAVWLVLARKEKPGLLSGGLVFLCIVAATLFRLEMLFVYIPLFLFYLSAQDQRKNILPLAIFPVVAGMAFLAGIYFFIDGAAERLEKYAGIIDVTEIVKKVDYFGGVIGSQVLHEISKDYGIWVLVTGLFSIVVVTLMGHLGVLFLVPALSRSGVSKSARMDCVDKRLYASLVLFWGAVLIAFLFARFFISSRYAVPLSLSLLPFLYVCVGDFIRQNRRGLVAALAFLFVIHGLSNLIATKGYEKKVIMDSGRWVAEKLPEDKVHINDGRISFYAERGYVQDDDVEDGPSKDDIWQVLLADKERETALVEGAKGNYEFIRRFDSGGDATVLVFKKR